LLSPEDVEKTLDALQAMGVNTIRIGVPWVYVQPLPLPYYYWDQVDLMVNAAVDRNMGVLAAVSSAPFWLGPPFLSAHPSPEAYAEFIGLVAERYQGKISAYEVWNEPNVFNFQNPVDPAFYTRMLQAAYPAIKAADPEATVVGGVLISAFTALPVSINPRDFLATMYENGAKGYFDAISYHPYHLTLPFSESGPFLRGALRYYRDMRAVMDLNGDEDLKVWISEYGVPTGNIDGTVVDEAYQAEFIEDLLGFWPTVNGPDRPEGPVYIYTTRDFLTGDPDPQYNFGVFQTDWTPKLAAYIIAQYAGGLVEPPPEGPDRPIIDAAIAFARTIVDATVRVINAGYDLFRAAVDVTVQVIRGLVDLGVRVVSGLAQVSVAVIAGIVDTVEAVVGQITEQFGPDDGTTPENETLRVLRTDTQLSDEPSAELDLRTDGGRFDRD
jgi:polysaccharide biosynthesis protein PslG